MFKWRCWWDGHIEASGMPFPDVMVGESHRPFRCCRCGLVWWPGREGECE